MLESNLDRAALRRRVQAGLWAFFAGTVALLASLVGLFFDAPELIDGFPAWTTAWVPQSPAGYTAATLLVAWGVWTLGAGLEKARDR
ncbi:hypothetical protein [Ramlibacter humi]|uniref:Uncharacterized protein n=1 Tax=Ramlibacter humi TaxID=2530451 RepID=A0A4Z0BWS2_9BURK|nr:hypothetical protein [Ramlibacter humi]TFZ03787.1 hypothetical protein EZ216_09030 [Ramlibacter humi]